MSKWQAGPRRNYRHRFMIYRYRFMISYLFHFFWYTRGTTFTLQLNLQEVLPSATFQTCRSPQISAFPPPRRYYSTSTMCEQKMKEKRKSNPVAGTVGTPIQEHPVTSRNKHYLRHIARICGGKRIAFSMVGAKFECSSRLHCWKPFLGQVHLKLV